MFPADPHFEVRLYLSSLLDADPDELPDSLLIQHLESVPFQYSQLHVARDKLSGIVPRKAESSLRQVISAEGKEFGYAPDFIRHKRGAWDLDHRPDKVLECHLFVPHHFGGDAPDNGFLMLQLPDIPDEWDHHLRHHFDPSSSHGRRGLEDRARLHL